MTKYILLCLAMFWANLAFSQNSYRAIVKDHETDQPLPGASVQVLELGKGGVADESGAVLIEELPNGIYTLEVRFLGFETLKFQRTFPMESGAEPEVLFLHNHEDELEELVVQSTRSTRLIEDVPTRVEIIAGEELAEKGNMKPGDIRMLLNESTGIQTQQTSATSYNSSIRIQGLDGKYTQLLRDGLPLYGGYSGGLSLMQIAPLDLAQVEVVKGSSSTLYGGGAIAGLVNLISKKPTEEPELGILLNGTSALGLDASAFYAEDFGKIGTTVFASYNKGTAYDPADIGLTAIPEFDRFTLNPKIYWEINEVSDLMLGVNLMKEDRLGGNVDFIKRESVVDPYFEENLTERISTQLDFTRELSSDTRLNVKNSISFYDRSIEIPDYQFAGTQWSTFSEVNVSRVGSKAEWIGGLNFWSDRFVQSAGNPNEPLDYKLNTIGGFVQNIWNISEQWTMESGFRLDYQKEYGVFALPRLSVMVEPSELLTLRFGGGLGYKPPTVFSEEAERLQFQNILPIDPTEVHAERSAGANLDANYRLAMGEELTLNVNALLFWTQIQDPLVLTAAGGFYEFQQPQGELQTQGLELNLKWEYRDLKLFVGYTLADVDQHYDGTSATYPLVAKHRLNNVLMYEKHENFRIGLEAYYFSPQLLNDGATGKSYWIMGLMTEKSFGERVSVFLNFENFLDARQTRFDTIYTGSISNPEFRDIYAPVDGFVINGGVKLRVL
ncbi:TonB-dependent receptor [Algoriphagus terrigena]|uniref:TonB-dependent receptor n=1 Tax=Algoriphagus terrigena TaxID=344884 RepID=UPI000421B32A|nr:TonB-dependent receptor [Algoriphagus terrigena]